MEFLLETGNIEELKSFDWSMVAEMFQENDENQEITLGFSYVNEPEKTRIKNTIKIVTHEKIN